MPLQGNTLFVGDLHGDPTMDESIALASAIMPVERIVQTGDAVDRWNENIATLRQLDALRVRYGDAFRMLIGNHELSMVQSLRHEEPEDTALWMNNGGCMLLKEICDADPSLQKATLRAMPVNFMASGALTPAAMLWGRTIHQYTLPQTYDYRAAFIQAQQMMLHGEFKALLEGMDLVYRDGKVLAVHATVNNEKLAHMIRIAGADGVNEAYHNVWTNDDLHLFTDKDQLQPVLWARDGFGNADPSITSVTAGIYRGVGIRAFVRAHDRNVLGKVRIERLENMAFVNIDTASSRGYEGNGASGLLIAKDGVMRSFDRKGNREIGRIRGA